MKNEPLVQGLGKRLVHLRKMNHYTPQQAAQGIGVTVSTYLKYESGRTIMNVIVLNTIADFYHMPVADLINGL